MGAAPEVGRKAPDFILPTTAGRFTLTEAIKERKVVLAFYSEDNTPTCTTQLSSFTEEYDTLRELGAEVLGISVDSLSTHERFVENLGKVPFPLASDEDGEVARLYDVVDESGKRSRRAIFIVDRDGTLIYKNPRYTPGNPGHYMEIFQALGMEVG